MTKAARSVLIVKKAQNLMIRKKCVFQVCFLNFFQQPSKIFLIPLNGLGTECAKGTDCPDDQVCEKLKCVACGAGTKPDDKQENCSSNGESNCGELFNVILVLLSLWGFVFYMFLN